MKAEPVASRFYARTILEHERRLSGTGEVLVAAGDRVESQSVVARGVQPGSVRVIDAAQALGVACDRVPAYLRVRAGQELRPGDVLAASGFMGLRTLRTPVAGRVAEIATGRIFVEEPPRTVELEALLPGQVVRVLPGQGAVIRATVSRVIGVWGAGSEGYGPLAIRTETATEALRSTSIDADCRGRIIVGGQCLDSRVLQEAARCEALGLVVGGLAEHLRAKAEELGLIVVVTDALGRVPMAGPIFDLLAESEGREGLVAGGRGERATGPAALSIPLPADQEPVPTVPERPLAIGDRVRATRAPYLGATGWVQGFQEQGGETWVKVSLEQGVTALVLYRNLERLG